jgi:hypothetical protein
LAGYYFHGNHDLPFEEFQRRSHCIYLHHFSDHSLCDIKWCKVLQYCSQQDHPVKDEELPPNLQPGSQFYRCKKRSWHLFARIKEGLAPYFMEEALRQVWHCYSTQKNEALNKCTSKMIPKDKFFGNACTLHDCLRMIVIEDSKGFQAGFNALLAVLQIPFTPMLREWCHWKDQEIKKAWQIQSKKRNKGQEAAEHQDKNI